MKCSKLIKKLEYWKEISGKEDPEVAVSDGNFVYEIDDLDPVQGIEEERAIGITFFYD